MLYLDEYYAATKAKRRGLGLIRFIGELFKLQMLTERIMHECIKKLLGNVENPEEEIESLCKLLTTVGSLLDTPKARAHLDVYFSRMRELTKNKNVNARMIFMLQVRVIISCPQLTLTDVPTQDVIELREHKWVPRNTIAAPATIAQVHEAVSFNPDHRIPLIDDLSYRSPKRSWLGRKTRTCDKMLACRAADLVVVAIEILRKLLSLMDGPLLAQALLVPDRRQAIYHSLGRSTRQR